MWRYVASVVKIKLSLLFRLMLDLFPAENR